MYPRSYLCATVLFAIMLLTASHPAQAQNDNDRLTLTPKTMEITDQITVEAEVGRLKVPENRNAPNTRTIELAFVRLKSPAAEPVAPLIYLAGGPGGWSTYYADYPGILESWLSVIGQGDLIFLDQRGTGRSTPNMLYDTERIPPADFYSDATVGARAYADLVKEAAAHFRAEGFDLEAYNSVASADDINDLREALGYDKISLLGFSYGTHLALATMRRHGDVLDAVVCVGTEGLHQTYKLPLNLDIQFKKLSLLAARDTAVSTLVPDMYALYLEVLAQLAQEPMEVTVIDGAVGPRRVTVGPSGLQYILRRDIGDARDFVVFPKLLYTLSRGDASVLQWFVQKRWPNQRVNLMSVVMDAMSGASPERLALIEAQAKRSDFGHAANWPEPALIDALGIKTLDQGFRDPFASDVRALFLTGEHDWHTPPHQARQASWGVPNAICLDVKNAGHEQVLPLPEVQEVIVRFLRGEDVSGVSLAYEPVRFVPIEGYDPERSHESVGLEQRMKFAYLSGGIDAAVSAYHDFTGKYEIGWDEEVLNDIGYDLLGAEMYEDAITIFALNAEEHPDSYNAWDSLAESHMRAGNDARARELYRKSLELNPDNTNAVQMLEKLGE